MSGRPSRSDSPALEIRNVTKRYGSLVAVDSLSLTVHREIFGLIGANGAGKSTVLRSILGLVKIDAGAILVDGVDALRDPTRARQRVGYLPEDLRLYDRLTGWEFLRFVGGVKGINDTSEIVEGLEYFALTIWKDVLIEEYSLGMKKKVGLIAALLGSPALVLLDEPLNGLDTESMRLLRLRIESAHREGATFVVCSHIMGFVERTCHRIAILRNGKVVVEGPPSNVRDASRMPSAPFEDVFLHFAL